MSYGHDYHGAVMDRVIARLREGPATAEELAVAAYQDEFGGRWPESWENCMRVVLHRIRSYGFDLNRQSVYTLGPGTPNAYRIVRAWRSIT